MPLSHFRGRRRRLGDSHLLHKTQARGSTQPQVEVREALGWTGDDRAADYAASASWICTVAAHKHVVELALGSHRPSTSVLRAHRVRSARAQSAVCASTVGTTPCYSCWCDGRVLFRWRLYALRVAWTRASGCRALGMGDRACRCESGGVEARPQLSSRDSSLTCRCSRRAICGVAPAARSWDSPAAELGR